MDGRTRGVKRGGKNSLQINTEQLAFSQLSSKKCNLHGALVANKQDLLMTGRATDAETDACLLSQLFQRTLFCFFVPARATHNFTRFRRF